MNNIDVTEFRLKLYPKDFARVRAFYQDVLGFSVINEWDRGTSDQGVIFQVGTTILELLTPEDGYSEIRGADVSWEVTDVWKLWESLKDGENVVFALRDNDWGDSSFKITDPEGFGITFFTRHERR